MSWWATSSPSGSGCAGVVERVLALPDYRGPTLAEWEEIWAGRAAPGPALARRLAGLGGRGPVGGAAAPELQGARDLGARTRQGASRGRQRPGRVAGADLERGEPPALRAASALHGHPASVGKLPGAGPRGRGSTMPAQTQTQTPPITSTATGPTRPAASSGRCGAGSALAILRGGTTTFGSPPVDQIGNRRDRIFVPHCTVVAIPVLGGLHRRYEGTAA